MTTLIIHFNFFATFYLISLNVHTIESKWQLVFQDDFNKNEIDVEKWGINNDQENDQEDKE